MQVIPSDRPLTYEWLEELGAFLLDRGWLSRAERATWDLGGFFWRRIHSTGLCAIGLNSQLWSATPQGNHTMRRAQLAWLPGVLARQVRPNPNPHPNPHPSPTPHPSPSPNPNPKQDVERMMENGVKINPLLRARYGKATG